jgi:hypothetical protein
MKYIKLFEELASDLPTLRDVIDNNPDDFEDFKPAAVETASALGLKLSGEDSEFQELQDMGIIDDDALFDKLNFDRVKLVFNLTELTHADTPRLRALVQKFPGLFTLDYDELRPARKAVPDKTIDPEVDLEPGEPVDVIVWKDQAGNTAVQWESYYQRMWFMLDSAL